MSQASLRTAQGAGQGLESLLARRLLDRRQQLDEQQFAETQRRAQSQEEFQRQQLEENSKIRLMHEQELIDQHNEAERMKRVNIAMLRPIGSTVTPEEMTSEKEAGVPSGMYDWTPGNLGMSTPEGEIGPTPTRIRWQGKEADQQREDQQKALDAYRQAQIDQRKSEELTRIKIAEIQAMKPGAIKIASINVDGRDIAVAVHSDGSVVPIGNSQLPAGMKEKNADAQSLVDQIDTVLASGDKMKWPGIGFATAPIQSGLKRLTGYGKDEEDQMRIALNSIRAEVAHEKYGSAFTATERSMLNEFAPSANMHPNAVKNRLQVMRNMIANRVAQRKAGQPLTPITPDMLRETPAFMNQAGVGPGAPSGMNFPLPQGGNTFNVGQYKVTVK